MILATALGPLGAVGGFERLCRGQSVLHVLGVEDFRQRGLGASVRGLGQGGQDVALHVNQHRCSLVVGNTSRSAFQNPSAVTHGQHRGTHPAALAVAQQVSPGTRWTPGTPRPARRAPWCHRPGPNHHQQADLVLGQGDFEVDPVDPAVHLLTRPGRRAVGLDRDPVDHAVAGGRQGVRQAVEG